MESEVRLYQFESTVSVPLVKGTSDKNERVSELERVMRVVYAYASSPAVKFVN